MNENRLKIGIIVAVVIVTVAMYGGFLEDKEVHSTPCSTNSESSPTPTPAPTPALTPGLTRDIHLIVTAHYKMLLYTGTYTYEYDWYGAPMSDDVVRAMVWQKASETAAENHVTLISLDIVISTI